MSSSPPSLAELEKQVNDILQGVVNDPEGRFELRKRFYERYGDGKGHQSGLGNSELAFLQWEIDRGVLNPMDAPKPGSPWWREVNSRFIFYAELAALIHEKNPELEAHQHCVRLWRNYIDEPNEQSWYRAHNSSIVAGYLEHKEEGEKESIPERIFVNAVLYRVLFAQGMVEGVELGELGEVLANPRLPSVDVLVHIPEFYPRHYPMTKNDIKNVLRQSHNIGEDLVDVLDEVFIIPHLQELYEEASKWLSTPELLSFLKQKIPVYPNLSPQQGAPLVHRGWWERLLFYLLQFLSGIFKK